MLAESNCLSCKSRQLRAPDLNLRSGHPPTSSRLPPKFDRHINNIGVRSFVLSGAPLIFNDLREPASPGRRGPAPRRQATCQVLVRTGQFCYL
jgi:hypothetical protein